MNVKRSRPQTERELTSDRADGAGRKILVTGGAGFIGSHTCVALIEQGYEPVVVDTFANSSTEVVNRIRELTGHEVRVHRIDVRDTDALRRILSNGIDAVVHFAALKAVGDSVERPLEYYDNNIGGTVSVLRAMRDAAVGALVYSGSCSIFGDTHESPLREDAAIAPTNPYARTKAIGETILADTCATADELSVTSLRYFNPIGAHASGRLGEDPLGIPNNLLPFAIQVAVGRRKELKIFGDDYATPDGTCIRDYIHVVDIAEAHVRALGTFDRMAGFRAINLGTGRGTSVHELVAHVRQVTGRPVPTVVAPRRAGDVPMLIADPTLAGETLRWRSKFTIRDMVAHAWCFQRENPYGYRDRSATGDFSQVRRGGGSKPFANARLRTGPD